LNLVLQFSMKCCKSLACS